MLSGLFIYSLKSSVVLCILYLAYHFLFRKNTHFQAKRVVLLSMIVVSLGFPLLQYQTQIQLAPELPVIQRIESLWTDTPDKPAKPAPSANSHLAKADTDISAEAEVETKPIAEPVSTATRGVKTDWLQVAMYTYLGGFLLMVSLFFFEICRIAWLLIFGKARHDLDRMAITHRWVRFPFSFWKWIFVPARLSYDASTWRMIQEHELVHLKQGHTLDVILSAFIRCLLWFNPAIYLLQRQIKDNHEALADSSILQSHDLSSYSTALLNVCLETGSLNLGHAFALKSNLSKRLGIMKAAKTPILRSVLSMLILLIIAFGLFTQTSLYGQEDEAKKPTTSIQKAIENGILFFDFIADRQLTKRHQLVLEKLKKYNLDKDLNWRYLKSNEILEYLEEFKPHQETIYFDKLTNKDREEIWALVQVDEHVNNIQINGETFGLEDFGDKLKEEVFKSYNYLLIYKKKGDLYTEDHNEVYEAYEVDELPEPVGGLQNFARSIALDMQLPEGIEKADLPRTIDFEFVVKGGGNLSEMNLITELSEDTENLDKIYKFFGTVHNAIRSKTRSVHNWKRGIKDGQPVNVRIVVSIPTKFM